jgi:hypothetical protein
MLPELGATEALQAHERPKQRSKRKGRRLSPAELEAVIETAERLTPSFAPLFVLLAFTGLRIREALALRFGRTLTSTPRRFASAGNSPWTIGPTSRSRPTQACATCADPAATPPQAGRAPTRLPVDAPR